MRKFDESDNFLKFHVCMIGKFMNKLYLLRSTSIELIKMNYFKFCLAASAAPIIPALFNNLAGTTGVSIFRCS